MASLCTIQIIGNVGRDPEIRYTTNNRQVTSFSVAVNRVTTVNGERKEETEWFRVSCWGQLAQTAEQLVQKGKQVYVSGRFASRAYTGNDGQQRYALEITADQLVLVGAPPRADLGDMRDSTTAAPAPAAASARGRPAPPPSYADDVTDDDIPF